MNTYPRPVVGRIVIIDRTVVTEKIRLFILSTHCHWCKAPVTNIDTPCYWMSWHCCYKYWNKLRNKETNDEQRGGREEEGKEGWEKTKTSRIYTGGSYVEQLVKQWEISLFYNKLL